jgi:hypothetical protein
MKYNEILNEYYDMADDQLGMLHKDDTRRPRLTLRHVNKLKRVRELRRIEAGERERNLPKIYGQPPSM